MQKHLFIFCLFLCSIPAFSQYTGLNTSADRSRFCSQSNVITVNGSVRANSNVSNGYHFVGMIYHFYYNNGGSINPIGDYRISVASGTMAQSWSNINTVYFDGSQINGAQIIQNTYNAGSPLSGGYFSASINVPWYAFPTSNGVQFYVAVEAIDQAGSTTVVSSKFTFDSPILYSNAVLTPPAISATKTTLCGADQTTISTNPDLSGAYTYLWYKDGSILPGQNGPSLTTASTGSYYAYIYDACQSISSDNIIITTGQVPSPPTITSDHGQLLCDGASANLFVSGAGGTYTWSNGASGTSITVNAAGTYTATESNACGTSAPSNSITLTVGTKPAAPVVTPATNQLLCNGASVSLYSSGSNITWSNGATGNTITTSTAGTYLTYDQNSCGNSPNSNAVVINTATCPMPVPGSAFQVCPGTLKTLDAGAGYDTYLWSNGATTQTIAVGAGTYHVTVTKNGCSNISSDVTVSYYALVTPVITASGATTICAGANVTLTSSPGSAYAWSNGATSQAITVGNAGGYYVTVTDANGCPATSASVNITVNPLPTASISGSTTVCQNGTQPQITFTGNNATAPYTFTYQVNGGAYQTVTTSSGNTVSINVPTNSPGTFNYSLVSVKESSGTTCENVASGSATVIVRQLPTSTIAGTNAVCQNATAPQVTFTGAQGTPPYTFTYNINGGSNQTVTTTSVSNLVAVNAPTNTPGTYTYNLVSVQEASGVTCNNVVSGSAVIKVNPLPTASISGTNTVCQYATAPFIRFEGAGGTVPYTFRYQVNGGSIQTVTTIGPSTGIDIPVATNIAGNFVYTLLSVKDNSSTACLNTANGTATITVNPQPSIAVLKTPNNHLCNGASEQITVFNSVTGYNYTWYKDGEVLTNTTIPSITNSTAGSFTVLMTSDKGCAASSVSAPLIITIGSVAPPVITGSLRVCPGGASTLAAVPIDTGQPYDQWRWTDSLNKKTLSRDSIFSAYAGQYHVTVRTQGCYDSTFVIVTPNDTAYPAGQLIVSPSSIQYGGQVLLSANTTNSKNFQWDLGDGTTVNSNTNRLLQNYFVSGDSLFVRVKAISERNCITPFTAVVKVAPQIKDTVTDLSKTLSMKDWNAFPTPFRNDLKVTMLLVKNESVKIEAFTVDGSFVMAWIVAAKKGENLFNLNRVENLASNTMYLVTAIYNGKKHYAKIFKY